MQIQQVPTDTTYGIVVSVLYHGYSPWLTFVGIRKWPDRPHSFIPTLIENFKAALPSETVSTNGSKSHPMLI